MQFAAKSKVARRITSTSKFEVMVLSMDCYLWIGTESLPQVQEVKYRRV